MKHKKKKNHTYLADIVQKVISPNNTWTTEKLTTKQKKKHTKIKNYYNIPCTLLLYTLGTLDPRCDSIVTLEYRRYSLEVVYWNTSKSKRISLFSTRKLALLSAGSLFTRENFAFAEWGKGRSCRRNDLDEGESTCRRNDRLPSWMERSAYREVAVEYSSEK